MVDFVPLTRTLLVYLVLTVLCFRLFRTYSGILRFSSFVDLQKVAYATVTSLVLAIGAHYVMDDLPKTTFAYLTVRQTIAIYVVATVLMWIERVLVKYGKLNVVTIEELAASCL